MKIEFRGKRVNNGEWVYGNLITMNNKSSYGKDGVFSNKWIMEVVDCLEVDSFKSGCEVWTENTCIQVHPESVGQWTELKDQNGVDIYKGDIVEIEWDDGEITTDTIIWCDWGYCTSNFSDMPDCAQVKVIGNITDNPELLETN
jgi:hypothetical protein